MNNNGVYYFLNNSDANIDQSNGNFVMILNGQEVYNNEVPIGNLDPIVLTKDYLKEDYRLLRIMAIYWGGTDFIIFIQYCLTLTIGIYYSVNGVLEPGQFIAFLSYVGMIVWPMRQLGRIVGDFGKTTVALDRLDDIMLKDSEHKDDSNRWRYGKSYTL